MRIKLLLSALAITLGFMGAQGAFADCVQTGNTPSGGNIIECPAPVQNAPLNPGSVPPTTELADEINIPTGGGIIRNAGTAIQAGDGDDIITSSGEITGSSGVLTREGNDTVIVNGGSINSVSTSAILTADDDDTIIVNGGVINAGTRAIGSGNGNDIVILNGGTYTAGATAVVELSDDNDTLTFGADIDLGGLVDCGEDFDTLIFAMEVPLEAVPFITSQIITAQLPDGSITINDVLYEWENCELLLPEVIGVRNIRPIPTLSQWGLIAMAGVLGIIGLIVISRRKAMA